MQSKILSITAVVFASLAISSNTHAQVETYAIDPDHSSVKFSIRHFVAKTTGNFAKFEGTIQVDRSDLTKSSVDATISIASVNTDNKKRDEHLLESEYFDHAAYPAMSFKSTKWKAAEGENKFTVTGDLTIRGITKTVDLDVELLGFGEGMNGAQLSGWEIQTLLDRTDFGIDGGQPAVGNEVDVKINIEAIRQ